MSVASALEEACRDVVGRLPVSWSVVHLMAGRGSAGVAAASGAHARALAELPFTTGVGPCLDAYRLRRPVLVGDLALVAGRWPAYADAALEHGVKAVFSLPLQVGAVGLGVLDLYADEVGVLADKDMTEALSSADRITDVLLTGGRDVHHDRVTEGVDHRAEIYQAQGALVVDLGVGLAEAMALMRAHAFASGVPLLELARQIVAGASLPEDW